MRGLGVALLFIFSESMYGQPLPVEITAGHKRTGTDILWFKNFSSDKTKVSPWLFFHRTRASVNYSNQIFFGITHAVSYNFKNGLGMVAVTQFLQNGFVAKGGVQYFRSFHNGIFFSWLVAGNNTAQNFSGDWFALLRWTPPVNDKWKWFTQLELLNSSDDEAVKNLTQRLRLGAGINHWQFGAAADFNQTGNNKLTATNNIGLFL